MAHLGLNDLIDLKNDRAKGMKSITVLYGIKGTKYWITGFVLLHLLTTTLFLKDLGVIAHYGFLAGFVLLAGSNLYLWKEKSPGGRNEDTSPFPRNTCNICDIYHS